MKVGLVAQRGNARATYLAERLWAALIDADVGVAVQSETATALDLDGVPASALAETTFAVSIGGDGTFLYTAGHAGTTPVLGVNLGEVGFLNAVRPQDAVAAVLTEVERYRETGVVRSRSVPRIQATVEGEPVPPAINEIVVLGPQRGRGHGAGFEVRVDGSLYAGSHADGVIVATPTGTTAYNLSERGPLVRPGVEALVVTEMAARDPMPPLVTDLDSTITVRVEDAPTAFVVSDGDDRVTVTPPALVTVGVAEDPLRIAGPPVNFFEALGKLD